MYIWKKKKKKSPAKLSSKEITQLKYPTDSLWEFYFLYILMTLTYMSL